MAHRAALCCAVTPGISEGKGIEFVVLMHHIFSFQQLEKAELIEK